MKTTNNIEQSVFRKLVKERTPEGLGLIRDGNYVKVYRTFCLLLKTLNDSILMAAVKGSPHEEFYIRAESGVKRITDDLNSLVFKAHVTLEFEKNHSGLKVFEAENKVLREIVALYRLEGGRLYQIEEIDGTVMPLNSEISEHMQSSWQEVLDSDSFDF